MKEGQNRKRAFTDEELKIIDKGVDELVKSASKDDIISAFSTHKNSEESIVKTEKTEQKAVGKFTQAEIEKQQEAMDKAKCGASCTIM